MSEYIVIGTIIAAFAVAAVLSYFFTPPVKNFAHKVGAIDVPKDARRMHKKPIPRLGGLAIYGGFLCSILIFGQLDETMLCVLLGAAIIVALGIFDDVLALGAKLQIRGADCGGSHPGLHRRSADWSVHQSESAVGYAVCPSRHSGSAGHDYLDCRHHECGKSD